MELVAVFEFGVLVLGTDILSSDSLVSKRLRKVMENMIPGQTSMVWTTLDSIESANCKRIITR